MRDPEGKNPKSECRNPKQNRKIQRVKIPNVPAIIDVSSSPARSRGFIRPESPCGAVLCEKGRIHGRGENCGNGQMVRTAIEVSPRRLGISNSRRGRQSSAGGAALPGIRDELVQRLTEIEPSLAAVVENTYLFSRSDLAAVKLARWAELLRAMSSGAAEPAAVEEPAAAAGRTAPAASVNAQVIDLLCRRPESGTWSARQIATALRCSKSAVAESDAFKKLGTAREMARLERAERCQKANPRRDRK